MRVTALPAPVTAARPSRALRSVAVKAHLADKVPTHDGRLSATGLRFAIVIGRFNDLVTKLLLEGCLAALKKSVVSNVTDAHTTE